MSTVEIETGTYIKRFAFWNPATWSIPKLYWDAWSQEQRLHAICRQLEKVIAYADYIGVNTDDIAARLKAIEDGQLDDLIVSTVETWFEENEPQIMADITALEEALPITDFNSANTVKAAIDVIKEVLPITDFDSTNTVKAAIDAISNALAVIDADSWVTTNRIADNAVTPEKISTNVFFTPEQFGAVGDGVADDTQAFKDMLDAMSDGDTCVLVGNEYKITEPLFIDISFAKFTSFERSETKPCIRFTMDDFTDTICLTCHGTGNNFSNIHIGQSNRGATGNYLIYIDAVDHNYSCDYTFDNCVISYAWNAFAIVGRNVHITNCLISTIAATSITILGTVYDTPMRGYVFDNNRFHVAGMIVNTVNVTNYDEVFNLELSNNFIDFSKRLYLGITDNVTISNNVVAQTTLKNDFLVLASTTIKKDTCLHVCNNSVNTVGSIVSGADASIGGLISVAANAFGLFNISGNTFETIDTTDRAVISVASNTHALVFLITGNAIHTENNATPIQVVNSTNVTGIVTANSVTTAGSVNFISAAGLTVENNYTANVTM